MIIFFLYLLIYIYTIEVALASIITLASMLIKSVTISIDAARQYQVLHTSIIPGNKYKDMRCDMHASYRFLRTQAWTCVTLFCQSLRSSGQTRWAMATQECSLLCVTHPTHTRKHALGMQVFDPIVAVVVGSNLYFIICTSFIRWKKI
jgi:hypothetical protein